MKIQRMQPIKICLLILYLLCRIVFLDQGKGESMSKRSTTMNLVLMSVVPMALTACTSGSNEFANKEAPKVPTIYDSVDSCTFDGNSAKDCDNAFKTAAKESDSVAPKFKTKSDCELEFESCQEQKETAVAQNGNSGNVQHAGGGSFAPMMMGFMLGQMTGGSSSSGPAVAGFNSTATKPVYKSKGGQLSTLSHLGNGQVKANSVTARTMDAKAVAATKSARATAARSSSTRASSSRSAGYGRSGGFGG